MTAVKLTVLRKGQFCVVVNPVDKKCVPQWGTREVRVGHSSFFLHPGLMTVLNCSINIILTNIGYCHNVFFAIVEVTVRMLLIVGRM